MERIELIPEWSGSSFEKWSFLFCRKNSWRISTVIGDFDDAMSECLSCYYCCREMYGPTVKKQAQFMSLFKLIVTNWFNELSVKDTRIRLGMKGLAVVRKKKMDREVLIEQPSTTEGDVELAALLTNASNDLKLIMDIFKNSPKEILQTLGADCPDLDDDPAPFFQRIVRFCGIQESKSPALAKELKELLSHEG